MTVPPEIAVDDGELGCFWKAVDEAWPDTRHQRCWVHEKTNVPNKMPKSIHPAAKADLCKIWQAETRFDAEAAMGVFTEKYGTKYQKAVSCLTKDHDTLLAFFDFPAGHWDHLRTANPIKSVFATVRHRTVRTKGALSQKTVKLMVFTPIRAASKTSRRLIRPRHPNSGLASWGHQGSHGDLKNRRNPSAPSPRPLCRFITSLMPQRQGQGNFSK